MPYGRLAKVKGLPGGTGIGQTTILTSGSVRDYKVHQFADSAGGLLCVRLYLSCWII